MNNSENLDLSLWYENNHPDEAHEMMETSHVVPLGTTMWPG